MKALLKPTLLKLILTFVLLLTASYLWRLYTITTISDTFPWGFPLQFYLAWGPCRPGEVCSESNVPYFIIDILFWYIVAAFSVLLLSKKRGKLADPTWPPLLRFHLHPNRQCLNR